MKMSVEQWWNDTGRVQQKCSQTGTGFVAVSLTALIKLRVCSISTAAAHKAATQPFKNKQLPSSGATAAHEQADRLQERNCTIQM
jgi:hypothetical protein